MSTLNPVFVSSGAFRSRSLHEVLSRAIEWGIPALELSSGVAWSPDNIRLARDARRDGLELLVHNYFPPPEKSFVLNLASSDSGTLARSIDHCRRAMDLSAELGAPLYSVHSGFAISPQPEQLGKPLLDVPRSGLVDTRRRFVESVGILAAHAKTLGLTFALENNVLASFNLVDGRNEMLLCVTPEDILEFLGEVRATNVAVLLDVAHAIVSANSLGLKIDSFVDLLAGHIAAVHVSENDGLSDQNLPIRPDSWFLPHLAHLAVAHRAPIVLESYGLERSQILDCVAILRDAVKMDARA